jgi:hypothetical protein
MGFSILIYNLVLIVGVSIGLMMGLATVAAGLDWLFMGSTSASFGSIIRDGLDWGGSLAVLFIAAVVMAAFKK